MGILFLLITLKFVPGRYLKISIQENENSFISMILFYDYKFLKNRYTGE